MQHKTMTDLETLVDMMKQDGVVVTQAQAKAIALNDHDSVADFIEHYKSLAPPDFAPVDADISDKFKQPTSMKIL